MIHKVLIGVICLANLIWLIHAQVNCSVTRAGRFANPLDTSCRNYTLCVANRTSFVSYNYVCPSTSLFNPNTGQCTSPTNYVCNVTTTLAAPVASVCTTEGFVANPNDTTCSSYIICTLDSGNFTETITTCPTGSFYDPTTTLCDPAYICPVNFLCTAAGRFADGSDITCQRYYMCVLQVNNTYRQFNYTCPTTSLFNPNTRLCTSTYTCTN